MEIFYNLTIVVLCLKKRLFFKQPSVQFMEVTSYGHPLPSFYMQTEIPAATLTI